MRSENKLVRHLSTWSQVLRASSIASCMITCLIYFTSQKLSAMTEPIYSDPRVSVRQTKGRLQWNCSPNPLMESQWTLEPMGLEEQTAPLLERRTFFTQLPLTLAYVLLLLHSPGLKHCQAEWKGIKGAEKRGGYSNLDLFTLTFARSSWVCGKWYNSSLLNKQSWTLCLNWWLITRLVRMSDLNSKQASKARILQMVSISGCHFKAGLERKIHPVNNIIQIILMFSGNFWSNCRATIEGLCRTSKSKRILSIHLPPN